MRGAGEKIREETRLRERMETVIQIQNVTKTFVGKDNQVEALKGINLEIHKGEIYGIIGMSGAGKSTLVRCLNFLERPTSGTVLIEGKDLSTMSAGELRKTRTQIAMIFQHFNLLMQRTVIDNVCFPLEITKVPRKDALARARELLAIVGLSEKELAYPAQLSGGQKQRVSIAGVLAMHPKCIVLDEPTAMLDPSGRKEVVRAVRALNQVEGVTIILITHYMEEIIHADRVFVMDSGKIAMEGTPREIFSQVERLKELRLDVPQVTLLAYELQKKGLRLPDGILTVEEFADAIERL